MPSRRSLLLITSGVLLIAACAPARPAEMIRPKEDRIAEGSAGYEEAKGRRISDPPKEREGETAGPPPDSAPARVVESPSEVPGSGDRPPRKRISPQEVDDELKFLPHGVLKLGLSTDRDAIAVGQRASVDLTIAPLKPDTAIDAKAVLRISKHMEAKLTTESDCIKIVDGPHPEAQQLARTTGPTTWRWHIEGARAGTAELVGHVARELIDGKSWVRAHTTITIDPAPPKDEKVEGGGDDQRQAKSADRFINAMIAAMKAGNLTGAATILLQAIRDGDIAGAIGVVVLGLVVSILVIFKRAREAALWFVREKFDFLLSLLVKRKKDGNDRDQGKSANQDAHSRKPAQDEHRLN